MFWRRGPKKESRNGGSHAHHEEEDDLAKLQRQFGIKTVSDKDVEADLRRLLGGGGDGEDGGGSGLSPRSELALFGSGDDGDEDSDEEAKILRELNLGGRDLDAIDAAALSGGEEQDDDDDDNDGDGTRVARAELRGVLDEVLGAATKHAARTPMSEPPPPPQPRGRERDGEATAREQLHALKLRAVQLKREGNVQQALAVFREVRALEAQLDTDGGDRAHERSSTVPQQQRMVTTTTTTVVVAAASYVSDGEDDASAVEVTDEDMENPEFLAQLAALGLPMPTPKERQQPPLDTVESLEQAIREAKERAVQLKRSDRIAEALAEMRKFKEMEARLATLIQRSPPPPPPPPPPPAAAAAPLVRAPVVPSFLPAPVDDSDVEVTEDDMNDPAFAAELQKMGFDAAALGGEEEEKEREEEKGDAGPQHESATSLYSDHASSQPARVAQYAKQYSSMDDSDLIDAFDEENGGDSVDEEKVDALAMEEQEEEEEEEEAPERGQAPPVVGDMSEAAAPPTDESEPREQSQGASVEELQAQLQRAKLAAVQLKRQGDVAGAIETMRRVKQIEHLIELKQKQQQQHHHHQHQEPHTVVSVAVEPSPVDVERLRKFAELEALLVRFANEATQEAKDQLSINRAKAAEWLARRKEYSAQLATLRERRHTPGQDAPPFGLERLTEQLEVELKDVPPDEVHLRILSVNDLKQAAGKDVFVKFNLSFPSNAPQEGKTGVVRTSPSHPYASGPITSENAFRVKVQRGRGTQRLFEIKKAVFEVWRPGTLLRNPEFIARGYQELAPLLTRTEVKCHVPFVGPNRKPVGGDVEISLRVRTPLRDKQYETLVTEVVRVGEYPLPLEPPAALVAPPPAPRAGATHARPHSQSEVAMRVSEEPEATRLAHTKSVPTMPMASALAGASSTRSSVAAVDDLEDPHDLDLIVSYDVMNDEIARIEGALPSLQGDIAAEYSDRLDSLGLKKQLLEIEMQTEKLTLDMYVARLRRRIAEDRAIIKRLMKSGRKPDAARVLHRVKLMEKELEGTEGDDVPADE